MDLYNTILKTSKTLALENGLHTLNIRLVAKECNISVGSIYNYFPSKVDLIISTIKCTWENILRLDRADLYFENFISCIDYFLSLMHNNIKVYPNFFSVHSLAVSKAEKEKSLEMMSDFIKRIKKIFLQSLDNDINIKKNIFDDNLTKDIFIDYIFSLILESIYKNKNYKSLIKFIENAIY